MYLQNLAFMTLLCIFYPAFLRCKHGLYAFYYAATILTVHGVLGVSLLILLKVPSPEYSPVKERERVLS